MTVQSMRLIGNGIIGLSVVLFCACSKSNDSVIEQQAEELTITASLENATKTTVIDGGTDVYWEPSDQIKLFYNGSNGCFTTKCTEESAVSYFTGSIGGKVGNDWSFSDDTPLLGLYPYSEDATSDNNTITTALSHEQTGKAGSFASGVNISVSRSTSLEMGFYNVCGGLRFTVTNSNLNEVSFEGLNDEVLAGTIKIGFDDDSKPYISEVTDGEKKIILRAPNGTTFEVGKWYYITALPNSLTKGFRLIFNTSDKCARLDKETAVTINRGSFGSIEDADKGLTFSDRTEGGGDHPGGDIPGGDTPGGDIPGGDTPGGDTPGGGGGSTVVYPEGSTYTLSDASTSSKTNETISSTTSDYNVVQVTSGTLTLTGCTLTKSGDTSSDGDNSSFYGVNSALFVGPTDSTKYSATCTMTGGTINTSAKGSNACFATRGGVLNISGVTINTTANTSRGLHATYGGHINATDMNITTAGTSCSTVATDRGGGYVYVTGGSLTAKGTNSAVLYSTGTIVATNLTGTSAVGEIAVVEGTNSATITGCSMTSGSSNRAIMMLQSGSGDASGYNAAVNVYNSTLTVTESGTPLCEVPTLNMGTLKLSDVSLSVESGVLMKVDYNTQWQTYGGTGRLILETTTGTSDSPWIYTGSVVADSYSYASVKVGENVLWYGTIDNASTAKGDTLTVSGTWVLDSDANVDKLVINEGGTVIKNGHTLNYTTLSNNGTLDGTTTGRSYTQSKKQSCAKRRL